MSVRRETVYWHGCSEDGCQSDSHGCARVEIWWESLGRSDIIGHIYDGSIHCARCAEARFGADAGAEITGIDNEGNPVGTLAPWDEWWDATIPVCQFISCGTCGLLMDESHDQAACDCSSRDGVARLRKAS